MDNKVKKLKGSNMDIDFSVAAWGDSKCPWNVQENTDEHKCAIKIPRFANIFVEYNF